MLDAGRTPLITRQPVGRSVAPGQSAGFRVDAEGEWPMAYQWLKDGIVIPGATSGNYDIYNPVAANTGAYSVTITNRVGAVTSAAAALGLNSTAITAPVITRHPSSRTVTVGSNYLDLQVSLLDYNGISYQWRKDGTPIPGATSSPLSYYAVISALAGRYSVVVTNSAGSATSYDAVVAVTSVFTGPVFTVQPQNQTGYFGGSATFTSTATGASTVSYQWRKNGTAIAGATSSSLTLANLQAADAATYTVLASDTNGSTPSVAVTLALSGGTAPFLLSSPLNFTALAGNSASFTGGIGGTPTPTLQWRKDGVAVPGATGASLTLNNVQATNAGSYTLFGSNPVGSISTAPAQLTVIYPPPTISMQPASVSVQAGGTATFSVGASSFPGPTFQWRKEGVSLAGATSPSLVLTNVQSAHAGRYSVLVQTEFGSVTSIDAVLTVGNPITVIRPASQTVTAGGTATLSASMQSADPLLFRWARNGSYLPGATSFTLTLPNVQLVDAGTYVLVISRPDGTVIYPLTGSSALAATLTVIPKPGLTIVQHPIGGSVPVGGTFTLSVLATGEFWSYQWQKNGVPIPDQFGATLVLRNVQLSDSADYRAVAMGPNGTAYSTVAHVTVLGSLFAGTYFGTFNTGDSWAFHVNNDGRGVFIAVLSSRGQVIIARDIILTNSGQFSFGRAESVAASGASPLGGRYYTGAVGGSISPTLTTMSGQIPGLNLPLAGQRAEPRAGMRELAGSYQAVPMGSELGEVIIIAGADGSILLASVDPNAVRGGRGSMDTTGFFTVNQPAYQYRGLVGSPAAGALQGVYAPDGGVHVPFATPAGSTSSERLINVATRGIAGSGARTLTAGFVIAGTAPKDVLIRAVGPGLAAFGVTGVLANPRLRLYRSGTPMMENDDWGLGGFAVPIAAAATRVGAFALPAGSADAAVLARLEPGDYTAQISGEGDSTGVALVEVYDAVAPTFGEPKLINLSTRGEVGRGGDVLIVGVVVSGTAPKKALIRGIGPALAGFGVTGVLANPKLQLFQGKNLIRENDDWGGAIRLIPRAWRPRLRGWGRLDSRRAARMPRWCCIWRPATIRRR